MPVENSRLQGFYKLSVEDRRKKLAEIADLTDEHVNAWADAELDENIADGMVENVIGRYSLPIGAATNFIIDGEHYVIPFVVEEASVVAAASNMAKRCHARGGFISNNTDPVMIGQVQLVDVEDPGAAVSTILATKDELIRMCDEVDPILKKFGGGCRDIEARIVDTMSGPMVIIHILVDCRDAMGANAVNTMAETISSRLEELSGGGTAILRIVSNLAIRRLARVTAIFTPEEMSDRGNDAEAGAGVIDGVVRAYHFAAADPFRAATNNKGIMNAISSVAVACGQDWRAVEAGAHAYSSFEREQYSPMAEWSKDNEGNLVGTIEVPMAVGLVGGAVTVHPGAKANVALLGIKTANDLAKCIAAAGLAQNLGALRALATVGIQAGHMKLHLRNMATSVGAEPDEVEAVVSLAKKSGERITVALVEDALRRVREGN
mmetsp:Transcript_3488/g.4728  ORF Transcript_3488/g.4728 Transcript_3488/m.4728 type:complete len:435 (-) Transcript_3488:287-1591(-)|eukprot:CAMPEP_0185724622 /NCGR_PEP_ID=MMETSP1171-20130828/1044_1 /TAXON_ID=374046 /ORGANISM="Helicotheca tamensis, Strain CCMP826" /LENGTH=434 /DNA_ID=CAMNT_0028392505 /DNA_START=26 /DNA_END=1330 /DNA_ORIENTATION=-